MGGSTKVTNPPPPDPTAGMVAMASASVDKMAMYVGGQVMQTQMMTNMMNMQGLYQLTAQQDKLDAKMEIASLNYEARMKEAELDHEERMTELANEHIEHLADDGLITLDSENYQYPYQQYQWGAGSGTA